MEKITKETEEEVSYRQRWQWATWLTYGFWGDPKKVFSPEGPFKQTSLLVDWWMIDVDCYSFSHKLSVSLLACFADRGAAWCTTQAEWNTVPSENVPNGHIESANVYKTQPFPRRSKDCYPSLLAVASISLYMTTCTDSRGNCSKTSLLDFHVLLNCAIQLCIVAFIYIINWHKLVAGIFYQDLFFSILSVCNIISKLFSFYETMLIKYIMYCCVLLYFTAYPDDICLFCVFISLLRPQNWEFTPTFKAGWADSPRRHAMEKNWFHFILYMWFYLPCL